MRRINAVIGIEFFDEDRSFYSAVGFPKSGNITISSVAQNVSIASEIQSSADCGQFIKIEKAAEFDGPCFRPIAGPQITRWTTTRSEKQSATGDREILHLR